MIDLHSSQTRSVASWLFLSFAFITSNIIGRGTKLGEIALVRPCSSSSLPPPRASPPPPPGSSF
jgi:hypothetical protein